LISWLLSKSFFSLMVVNRLTEELGCDEIIDRE